MELTLILGPMKSGKSFELINHFAPLKYTNTPFALFQSNRNVRENEIHSRNGNSMEAHKVHSLNSALGKGYTVIGVDEIHMFPESDAEVVATLLKEGTSVIAAGLDTDYSGKLFGMIVKLLELAPREVRYHRAACEKCKKLEGAYTQVLYKNEPVRSGLPSVLPEDGTYTYQAVCRHCFVR